MKLLLTALLLLLCTPIIGADDPAGPLTPEAERDTFQLPDDLEIQLVACEPHVLDPVHIAWDPAGKMFVCEMGDYPQEPAGGQIRLLEDRDGDGVIDHSTVFAEDLHYPTSTLPYRGGVLVSAAPDILFLKDTDGDNKADVRKVLFTGFGEGNQQLRVNSLIWGLDGWVYGANGRSDGEVKCVARVDEGPLPEGATTEPVPIRGRDFRFHPELGVIEPTAGFSQFGHAFDDDGNRFLSWNTVHIRHVVLDPLSLTPYVHLSPQEACNEIADHGSTGRVYPASSTTKRFNPEEPGYFNASCGLTIFRGDALPEPYRGNAFVCEPLSNIVHRDVLKPDGVTFIASRDEHEQESEFLASTDSWFRPVNLTTGPDGALYVVDFYRELVEHPQFVANVEAREKTDFRKGNEVGRIWRIVKKGTKPAAWPNLAKLEPVKLVDQFQSQNGWLRDTAQREIIDFQSNAPTDFGAIAAALAQKLDAVATTDKGDRSRIHAIWTKGSMKWEAGLDSIRFGLDRFSNRFAEQLLMLLTSRIQSQSDINKFPASILDLLASSADPRIRLRLCWAIAPMQIDTSTEEGVMTAGALGSKLLEFWKLDGDSPWFQRQLLARAASPLERSEGAMPRLLLKLLCADLRNNPSPLTELQLKFVERLAHDQGRKSPVANLELLELLNSPANRVTAIAVLLGDTEAARHSQSANVSASTLNPSNTFRPLVNSVLATARDITGESKAADFERIFAIRLIANQPPGEGLPILQNLINADPSPELVSAAISALGNYRDPAIADVLLAGWPQATPALRRARLDVLLSRREYTEPVVAALEAKELAAADFDAINADRLLRLCDEAHRARAEPLLKRNVDANRAQVIASLQSALQLTGDSTRGSQVFIQNCKTCHAVRGVGNRIGPDLASVANRPPADVLVDILDPSRNVAADGMSYVVSIKDGRILSGLLGGENATSITLKRAEGEDVILRSEIEELRNTGRSLMPEGLEKNLNEQAFADLLAFLKKGEPPPKSN